MINPAGRGFGNGKKNDRRQTAVKNAGERQGTVVFYTVFLTE